MASNEEESPSFQSVEDENEYWKCQAKRFRELNDEVQMELREFRECSEEFEKELEVQLEQNEKQMKELKQQNTSLTFEYEALKERFEKQQEERFRQVSNLQNEVAKLNVTKAELTKDVRELEQRNDDLERTNRVIIVSLDDFEHRLNQALERNAFLESELDEKDLLATTVQRLRDEARDLHNELAVRQKKVSNKPEAEVNADENKAVEEAKPQTPPVTPAPQRTKKLLANGIAPTPVATPVKPASTPVKPASTPVKPASTPAKPASTPAKAASDRNLQRHPSINGVERTPLTPSARISALNIVGDLLRKVGALESKLASCRNFVQDQPNWHGKRSNSTKASESSQQTKTDSVNGRTPTPSAKMRV